MTDPKTPIPTDAELAILRVLWRQGAGTVRQVHDILSQRRPSAYTTTLKLMQIMTDKGLLERHADGRQHVYTPRVTETDTEQKLARDLSERAFGGSPARLAMSALAAKPSSAEELDEVRRLLDELADQSTTQEES